MIIVLGILFISVLVRVLVLNQSLWLDEAISALAAKNNSFTGLVTQFIKADNHPPFYYLILKAWADVFGYSEVSVRLLSVIFGVATVFVVYKIAQLLVKQALPSTVHHSLFTKYFPYLSAFLMAILPLHVYYSQEVRMYVPAGFFASTLIYFFLKTFEKKVKPISWVMFSLSLVFLIFTDYMPVFLLPILPVYAVLRKTDKKWRSSFLLSWAPMLVVGLVWLPTFIIQIKGGGNLLTNLPNWKLVAGGATIKQVALVWIKFILGRISLSNKAIYYSLILAVSIPFAVSLIKSFLKKGFLIIKLWLIVPLVLGFIASFLFPAFIYFRYIFVLPAFVLLLSYGILSLGDRLVRNVLFALIVLFSLLNLSIYYLDSNQHREDWRKAVSFVEARVKPDEKVVFINPEPFAPYQWYANNMNNIVGLVPEIGSGDTAIKNETERLLSSAKGIYLFEYLKDLNDPDNASLSEIEQMGFRKVNVFGGFGGVGQIFYYTRSQGYASSRF